MPLQELVEYFNSRLQREYQNARQSLALQAGQVHGRFAAVSLTTRLTPIRETRNIGQALGLKSALEISVYPGVDHADQQLNEDSVVSLDRLTRTVHMLNYLPHAHTDQLLFLDVDPRHVLAVKADHGAYFEDIIGKCGLNTNHVVINLTIDSVYSRLYYLLYLPMLVNGLENYRRRGYRLMLTFPADKLEAASLELIGRLSPDFVGLSLQNVASPLSVAASAAQIGGITGHSVLLDVEDQQGLTLAERLNFNYVQGEYLEQGAEAADAAAPQQLGL